ncbi:hypothetical protein RB653_008373 [Dictyostelium firmibasis]|uniref:Uncharacterized protein n=1 Tax=Dictyostelium firmibasis TaxID=79012 RepID=A0AAN7U4N2_9MYCE
MSSFNDYFEIQNVENLLPTLKLFKQFFFKNKQEITDNINKNKNINNNNNNNNSNYSFNNNNSNCNNSDIDNNTENNKTNSENKYNINNSIINDIFNNNIATYTPFNALNSCHGSSLFEIKPQPITCKDIN